MTTSHLLVRLNIRGGIKIVRENIFIGLIVFLVSGFAGIVVVSGRFAIAAIVLRYALGAMNRRLTLVAMRWFASGLFARLLITVRDMRRRLAIRRKGLTFMRNRLTFIVLIGFASMVISGDTAVAAIILLAV
ncbi:MAG: hypothetical protein E6713_06500 [Sporomusaceae bacterium]|nr:hypothetical protein [Sporomusaceae bacterium]